MRKQAFLQVGFSESSAGHRTPNRFRLLKWIASLALCLLMAIGLASLPLLDEHSVNGGVAFCTQVLHDSDKANIKTLARDFEIDFVSLSFTRSADDVKATSKFLYAIGLKSTKVCHRMHLPLSSCTFLLECAAARLLPSCLPSSHIRSHSYTPNFQHKDGGLGVPSTPKPNVFCDR